MNFKETEIGLIPCEWEYKSIGDCLYIKGRIGWKGLKKSEYLKKSNYRIINGSALNGKEIEWDKCGYISEERYNESPEIMLEKNDIVMTKDGTIGKVAIIDKLEYKTTVASGLFVIRVLNNSIDYKYLYYYFTSKYFSNLVKTRIEGSVIPHLYQKDLVELNIPLPQLNEQKAISKILSDLDKKIEINNKINKKLEEMAQAIFKQWFVDFEFPNEDGKPYKSSGGEMVESELGMIPKGWKVISLDKLMDYQGGSQPPSSEFKESFEQGYIRLVQIRDYDGDNHITYIPITSKLKLCNKYDIMLARYGAALGRVMFGLDGAYNVAIAKIIPKDPIYREWLRCYLNTDFFYRTLNNKGQRSAQSGFNQSDISSFKITFPVITDGIIDSFEKITSNIFEERLIKKAENNNLVKLRNSLLPKLMSGEIRVPMD